MAVRERRTTHYEWTCDGPGCDRVERVFGRGERPADWRTLKVTDRSTKAFCSDRCSTSWFNETLDFGIEPIELPVDMTGTSAAFESPNRNEVDAEAELYGANA